MVSNINLQGGAKYDKTGSDLAFFADGDGGVALEVVVVAAGAQEVDAFAQSPAHLVLNDPLAVDAWHVRALDDDGIAQPEAITAEHVG